MIFNQVVSTNSADAGVFQDYKASIAPEDPMAVYEATRPNDWLPMPTPSENEIYMLVHIPDRASTRLRFTISCSETCLVEIGTMRNGNFVSAIIDTVQSDTEYNRELFYSDFADLTSDKMEQAMVKISGATITSFNIGNHGTYEADGLVGNVVEIWCSLPSCIALECGGSIHMRYFNMIGTNKLSTASRMFQACYALLAVLQLDISMATSIASMFSGCYNLISIPTMNTSSVTYMSNAFFECRSIRSIPDLYTNRVNDFSSMFMNCYSLLHPPTISIQMQSNCSAMFAGCSSMLEFPALNYANITNSNGMFGGCSSLMHVPNTSFSKSTDIRSMFHNCTSLRSVGSLTISVATDLMQMFDGCCSLISIGKLSTPSASSAANIFRDCRSLVSLSFDKSLSSWSGVDITLPESLSPQAVVLFFNSLPTIASSKTITLSAKQWNNLTDTEKLIATKKKWALDYSN